MFREVHESKFARGVIKITINLEYTILITLINHTLHVLPYDVRTDVLRKSFKFTLILLTKRYKKQISGVLREKVRSYTVVRTYSVLSLVISVAKIATNLFVGGMETNKYLLFYDVF